MRSTNCLNCGKQLTDKFCSGCGQKSDTHRISFKHFIAHDVLHGTFHIEKGILFTAKEALVRPGKAALDYIAGKRIKYYNVFYLILITIGLMLFIRHFYSEILIERGITHLEDTSHLNEASKKMNEIVSQKNKIIIFLFVPLAAINSFMLFRRKRLNLSEHAIIAGMILLGILLISTFGNIFFYFNLIVDFSDSFSAWASTFIIALTFLYIGYGYWNAFAREYSKLGMLYRIILFFTILFVETFILLLLMIGFVTNWQFGVIEFNPF